MDDIGEPTEQPRANTGLHVNSGVIMGPQSDNEVLQVNNLLKSNGGMSDSNLLA